MLNTKSTSLLRYEAACALMLTITLKLLEQTGHSLLFLFMLAQYSLLLMYYLLRPMKTFSENVIQQTDEFNAHFLFKYRPHLPGYKECEYYETKKKGKKPSQAIGPSRQVFLLNDSHFLHILFNIGEVFLLRASSFLPWWPRLAATLAVPCRRRTHSSLQHSCRRVSLNIFSSSWRTLRHLCQSPRGTSYSAEPLLPLLLYTLLPFLKVKMT